MRSLVSLCVLLAGFGVACNGEPEPSAPGYERIAELDEEPLALLAQGDTVVMAAPAELVKIDDGSREMSRLTDGRYRECPWDPWSAWEQIWGPARLTPDGRFLTISAKLCGSWAWPLVDGDAQVLLARGTHDSVDEPADAPRWFRMETVPVARDGDGWIACGGTIHGGTELWSLTADGTPREKLGELHGQCHWISVEPDAIYAAHGSQFSRFNRATQNVTTLAKADAPSRTITVAGATPTHFVLVREHRVERVEKTPGGRIETIVDSTEMPSWYSLTAAVDETHVYWTDGRVLSRAPHADITRTETVLGADDERVFPLRGWPDMALTTNAIWLTAKLGPAESARPWLVRVPKPGR